LCSSQAALFTQEKLNTSNFKNREILQIRKGCLKTSLFHYIFPSLLIFSIVFRNLLAYNQIMYFGKIACPKKYRFFHYSTYYKQNKKKPIKQRREEI